MVPLTNVLKYGYTSHSNVDGSNGVGVAAAPANGGVGWN